MSKNDRRHALPRPSELAPFTRLRPWVVALIVTSLVGCGPPSPPRSSTPTMSTTAPPAGATAGAVMPCNNSMASPFPPRMNRRRAEALDALIAGRPDLASVALRDVLAAHPENLAAGALYVAHLSARREVAARAARVLAGAPRLSVSAVAPTPGGGRSSRAKLPNLATMTPAGTHFVDPVAARGRREALLPTADVYERRPAWVPDQLAENQRLWLRLEYDDHTILAYGKELFILDPGRRVVRVVDVSPVLAVQGCQATRHGRRCERMLRSAQVHAGWLYLGHERYDPGPPGSRDHLVSAIDLATGAIRFHSPSEVTGAANVVIRDGYVISGVRKGDRAGRVFILDARTGQILDQRDVGVAPLGFAVQSDHVLVLGRYADYRLPLPAASSARTSPFVGIAPTGVSTAATSLAAPTAVEPEARCALLTHFAQLDGAPPPVRHNTSGAGSPAVTDGWLATLHRLLELTGNGSRWALARAPVVVAPVPAPKMLRGGRAPIALHRTTSSPHKSFAMRDWLAVAGVSAYPRRLLPGMDQYGVDSASRSGPSEPRAPMFFGTEPLRDLWVFPDHTVLMYGRRYLLVVEAGNVWLALDLASLLDPKAKLEHGRMPPTVMWAQRANDRVLIGLGKGAVHTNSMVAVGREGQVMFNTGPITETSFAVGDGYVVSAHRKLNERPFVYVTSTMDGRVMSQTPLMQDPTWLLMHDHRLFVRAFERDIIFDIVPNRSATP